MPDAITDEAKAIYELSKVTSVSRQIMDDFINSVVMAIFKDYIMSFKHPGAALINYMDSWEDNILIQKKDELELLISHQESMADMVVGQKLAAEDNIDEYVVEVRNVKNIIMKALIEAIK